MRSNGDHLTRAGSGQVSDRESGQASTQMGEPRLGKLRSDFPLLAANPGLYYLDSAATSQKPSVVLDAMRSYYETSNANPHRGAYELSGRATEVYHDARARVARFLGIGDTDCLIFTRGTTEAINLVASAWGRANVHAGDEIVVTGMEHHANFVPWQQLAIEAGAVFRICELTPRGTLDLDHMEMLLNSRTKVVAFSHVSNALGTINPVREIARLVREKTNALVVCDGAQSAPHLPVRFDELGVDFYAFSSHKMCGPMGIGGLMGRREVLEAMRPYQLGGDMIEFVYDGHTTWNTLPHRFEAGTPNVGDAVGLAAATDYLRTIGMDALREHELGLLRAADARLGALEGITIYGPGAEGRSGSLSFNLDNVHPHDLATILDTMGVCIRAGHHCAQPLMRRLGTAATARASFHVYSEMHDIDMLISAVEEARRMFATVPG